MNSLILQELGIVVAMQQPNRNLVTAEFLKLSGISSCSDCIKSQGVSDSPGERLRQQKPDN
jgi:hypothetical protein